MDPSWRSRPCHATTAGLAAPRRHGNRYVRTVLDEKVATQFESRTGWQVLWATSEVISHSERDNWGHLYLYDLATGKLKRQITSDDGPVMQIARVDEKTRTLWVGANGREKDEDPYFLHFYRTSLEGSATVALTPDSGTHAIRLG
jgi:dipeptidyl-peptidase-4